MNGKIAFVCMIALMFVGTPLVTAIEITPSVLNIDGNDGDFKLQTIEIYNDNDESAVVNISVTGIQNYYIQKTTYNLKPYERKTITFGVTVSGSANGIIQYECKEETITQFVYINAEKSIMVFPQNPKAGTSFAVISTSSSTASGLVFVSETGSQYPVTLTGIPITFINLSKKDYGPAVLMLVWDDRQVTYNYFNITKAETSDESGGESKLSIDFGDSNTVDNPVEGSYIITKPDGDQILKDTNAMGQIQITLNEAGKWTFFATSHNLTATGLISVRKGNMTVNLPDKVNVGESLKIDVGEDANYTIITPDFDRVDGSAVGGIIKYSPKVAGQYKVIIETSKASDTENFDAYYTPRLVFRENGMPVTMLVTGKMYEIDVIDYNTGDTITDVREILASNNGITDRLPVTNGVAYFSPSKSGYYAFSIEENDDGYMNGYSSTFFVNSNSHKTSWLLRKFKQP